MGNRFMVYMSKRMIACDEASFLISFREDHRLGFWRCAQLKMHLLSCHLCRKYARQVGELNSSLELYREHCSKETCQHHLSSEASRKMLEALSRDLNAK
jgi:hypothetical protein